VLSRSPPAPPGKAALEPVPPPLPVWTLVGLLKHPLCVGEARRLVLEQLARHYGRPFADQWEFVRFAQEQKLNLDLLRPPLRLAPRETTGKCLLIGGAQ
jgi:hypothetical protein